jgi:hypothetical protein
MSLEDGTESMMSGEGGSRLQAGASMMSHDMHRPHIERAGSVAPNESASMHGGDSPPASAMGGAPHTALEELPFSFKFKAPSGRVHRLQVIASAGIEDLVSHVAAKLGSEVSAVGGTPSFEDGHMTKAGFALSYLDNEGDTVSITTNQDLIEAISLAHVAHRDKVDLFVHDPEKPPLQSTVEPHPGLAKPPPPPESVLRDRKQFFDEREEETHSRPRGQPAAAKAEELIAGVPNDLLLPGAIFTLAVVIIGVFVIGRASSR